MDETPPSVVAPGGRHPRDRVPEVRFDPETGFVLGPAAVFRGGPGDGGIAIPPHPTSVRVEGIEYELTLGLDTAYLRYIPIEETPPG